MRVAIHYPNEKSKKVKTLRFLRKNNIELNKITAIIDTAEDLIPKLKEFGNKLIELEYKNGKYSSESVELKYKKGFEILNRIFLKAIGEKNRAVVEFLRKNLTKEEIEFLKGVSK